MNKGVNNMACNHERLRCTDNRYFCAVCGAYLFDVDNANTQAAEKPAPEAKKTANKRKTKKDGE